MGAVWSCLHVDHIRNCCALEGRSSDEPIRSREWIHYCLTGSNGIDLRRFLLLFIVVFETAHIE